VFSCGVPAGETVLIKHPVKIKGRHPLDPPAARLNKIVNQSHIDMATCHIIMFLRIQ